MISRSIQAANRLISARIGAKGKKRRRRGGVGGEKGKMSLQGWHSKSIYAHLSKCDQNSFEVSRWYRTMTAKQEWRKYIFGSNQSLFVETATTPNKPVRIGRKEIGPSKNDYCRLCGLYFNVQYGNIGRNTGFEKCSSCRKSFAELCSFSQLSFVQNNNYSERVCCQCANKIRKLYDCSSFVKSFLEKEESNDLDKIIEINESWRTTTIASTPENETPILKTKFFGLKMLRKNWRANSRTN